MSWKHHTLQSWQWTVASGRSSADVNTWESRFHRQVLSLYKSARSKTGLNTLTWHRGCGDISCQITFLSRFRQTQTALFTSHVPKVNENLFWPLIYAFKNQCLLAKTAKTKNVGIKWSVSFLLQEHSFIQFFILRSYNSTKLLYGPWGKRYVKITMWKHFYLEILE